MLNYVLFASSVKPPSGDAFGFSGVNATLDARVFGPIGSLSQSAILGATTSRRTEALRLDTTWSASDPQNLLTYRAGDVISGGFAWTRPIRLGGLQVQRDFALRPDLVTQPLPTASGSAAVPSTLDVYVNNLKTYSQDIAAGPYQVTNIPTLSAGGSAQIILRDAAGHETQTNVPFYTSPNLLRRGLYDFSVETGMARLNYGVDSDDYLAAPLGSASLRAGLTDWLTLEAHAEGSSRLLNAGLGGVTGIGSWGVLSFAGSGSRFGNATGIQGYGAIDTEIFGVSLHASSQRTHRVIQRPRLHHYEQLSEYFCISRGLVRRRQFLGLADNPPTTEIPGHDLARRSVAFRQVLVQRGLRPSRSRCRNPLQSRDPLLFADAVREGHRLDHRVHRSVEPEEHRFLLWPVDPVGLSSIEPRADIFIGEPIAFERRRDRRGRSHEGADAGTRQLRLRYP